MRAVRASQLPYDEPVASNDYHFLTRWRVRGTPAQVSDLIERPTEFVRWWSAVYLEVEEIEHGVGGVLRLLTKGFLPYRLRWHLRITESRYPNGFSLEAWGDLVGRGVWTFEPDADWVTISYDWRLTVEKPLVRRLSFLLKPVFAANHRWAMTQGERGLTRELSRRASAPGSPGATPGPAPSRAR
jgi:hypothetical protein